jgi:hypothetical protein
MFVSHLSTDDDGGRGARAAPVAVEATARRSFTDSALPSIGKRAFSSAACNGLPPGTHL